MKKAKNELSRLTKEQVSFGKDDRFKKVLPVQKQKKPLSIYDNFDDEEEEIEDLYDIEEEEELDDYYDPDDEDSEDDDYYDDFDEDYDDDEDYYEEDEEDEKY